MSSRIHPSDAGRARRAAPAPADRPAVYTVWKRSSMGSRALTDSASTTPPAGWPSASTITPGGESSSPASCCSWMDKARRSSPSGHRLLSLHNRWNCYTATEEGIDTKQSPVSQQQQQLFTMRKCLALQTSDEAEVYMTTSPGAASPGLSWRDQKAPTPSFRVEGCFSKRNCKILGSDGQEAARILRKNAGVASRPVTTLGDDVFSLVVRPGVDAATIMAIVVVMDRICHKPYAPMVCSSQ
ncbi:hypothetical protein ACP70R_046909 [Stipagrostis hirtigluma subsp. patula]